MSTSLEKLSAEEKREALNLVLQSHTLSRSDRLKNLLRFVCEAEIEGRCEDLNEYVIGTEALGRPSGFSPGEASSVRSRAYELRRKLEKFYAAEAPGTSIHIEIPKGSYFPHFNRSPVQEERPAVLVQPAVVWPAVQSPVRRPLLPLFMA